MRNGGELFEPGLFPAIDASLDVGVFAAQYWADRAASKDSNFYGFLGGVATLWIRDTAARTSLTLIPLGGRRWGARRSALLAVYDRHCWIHINVAGQRIRVARTISHWSGRGV